MRFIQKLSICLLIIFCVFAEAGSAQENTSPQGIFDQVWKIFDTNYPYFNERNIDWDAIYRVYRPQITQQTTDAELFGILSSMLGLLNDGHINLKSEDMEFNAGINFNMKLDDFSEKLIRLTYLKGNFKARQDSILIYGWLDEGIGYLRIRRWKDKFGVGVIIDSILAEFREARGLVIDVRANTGGNAFAAEAVANRFADRKRIYGKSYPKRGPDHNAFFPPRYMCLDLESPLQFTKPVIVLQHRYSESASEGFIMAMRVLPHVTTIGDFTSGCFGMYYPDKLDNGWTIGLPWSYDVDQDDRCWCGIGFPPDLRILNSGDDIDSGHDKVLEFAIELIRKGVVPGREVPSSIKKMPESLYNRFMQTADLRGIPAAIEEFRRLQKQEADSFYFSPQECLNGAQVLFENGNSDLLIAVSELANQEWPDAISFSWILGMAYNQNGNIEQAIEAYRQIADREAYFPWEKSFVKQARDFLEANE